MAKKKYKPRKSKKIKISKRKAVPEGIAPDLWDLYINIAQKADKRLERLEKLAKEQPDMYEGILSYAYSVAERAIEHWDGDKDFAKPRFDRRHPKTNEEIELKIMDIQHFLDLPTSTKSGIDNSYKKRAEKLNEVMSELTNRDVNLSWQDWARFGVRGYWDRKDKKVTYIELIRIATDQEKLSKILNPYSYVMSHKGFFDTKTAWNELEDELKDEFGLSRDDLNLIKKARQTFFEDNKGIVNKHALNFMMNEGLTFDTMFGPSPK